MKVAAGIGVLLLLVVLLLILTPPPSPRSNASPLSPTVAEQRYRDRIAAERADRSLFPECVSLDVPAQRSRPLGVVVLLHGYTSCPHQMRSLAAELAGRGYRVVVPLLPGHGFSNTYSEPQPIDLQTFTDFGNAAVDTAVGLASDQSGDQSGDPDGGTVVVGGLSGGGALAMWLGAHRPEIDRVVAIAPLVNPAAVPTILQQPAGNLLRWLPNQRLWWDDKLANQPSVPRYSYGQYETHSIAALITLGVDLNRRPATAGEEFVFLLNDADGSVDNKAVSDRALQQRLAGDQVAIYRIPAAKGLPHEFIDVTNPENAARTAYTYPILLDILTSGDTRRLSRS